MVGVMIKLQDQSPSGHFIDTPSDWPVIFVLDTDALKSMPPLIPAAFSNMVPVSRPRSRPRVMVMPTLYDPVSIKVQSTKGMCQPRKVVW